MKTIAIITARGGSKRIPGKNIKDFCGKPIIAYSIDAALGAGIFDEVMVSTDSEEIASVARQYGAKVPFMRTEETSNDFATTADVVAEVLENYKATGKDYEYFACIYPTAPFITSKKLTEAMGNLSSSDADGIASVVKFEFPPQRAFIIDEGIVRYQYPEFEKTRSQDLEAIYHDCGQFYICKCDVFRKHHTMILPNTFPYIVPEEEVQDIDTQSDWVIAELKYRAMQGEN